LLSPPKASMATMPATCGIDAVIAHIRALPVAPIWVEGKAPPRAPFGKDEKSGS